MERGEKVVIGRNPKEANLVFRDVTVSRKHCVINVAEDAGYVITDVSECGVLLDGEAMPHGENVHVKAGTILTIGKSGSKICLM
jgi:predicted component of type VI protein secretion system